jgi:hypothetical protein
LIAPEVSGSREVLHLVSAFSYGSISRPSEQAPVSPCSPSSNRAVLRHFKALDAEQYDREADTLLERVVRQYGDRKPFGDQTLGERARAKLFRRHQLAGRKPHSRSEG